MKRYRKVWNHQTGESYEITGDEPRPQQSGPFFMPDIDAHYGDGFQSPVDGTFITSRSQLRDHNIRNNVRQNGDIKSGEIVREAKQRKERNYQLAEGSRGQWNNKLS